MQIELYLLYSNSRWFSENIPSTRFWLGPKKWDISYFQDFGDVSTNTNRVYLFSAKILSLPMSWRVSTYTQWVELKYFFTSVAALIFFFFLWLMHKWSFKNEIDSENHLINFPIIKIVIALENTFGWVEQIGHLTSNNFSRNPQHLTISYTYDSIKLVCQGIWLLHRKHTIKNMNLRVGVHGNFEIQCIHEPGSCCINTAWIWYPPLGLGWSNCSSILYHFHNTHYNTSTRTMMLILPLTSVFS